jgi:hypothetical protein
MKRRKHEKPKKEGREELERGRGGIELQKTYQDLYKMESK